MSDLHDYQLVAREFLRERNRAALFLDMGLGKTACSLSALEPRHLPALVVAPKRVAENVWHTEAARWRPDLRVAVAKGSPAERAALLASEADVVALGRDNLGDVLSAPRSVPFRTVILDELSGFKNRASVRWKTARKIVAQPSVEHVWGLTGTPSPNGLLDLWAQVALLDSGARLGKNITTYRSRYFTPGRQLPNGVITGWDLREGADAKIHALLEDLCLAMATDGRVSLPEVTFNDIAVELPARARTAYRDLHNTMVADLEDIFGGAIHTAANAATMTSRLSQITAGFVFVDEAQFNDYQYTRLHDEKVKALAEIVEAQDSPILVFYRFRPELAALVAAFPQARTVDEPGVIDDWNRGEVPLLLAHPASAGHGLNLQYGGHTIVWTSPTWSLEEWEQANKRLARQGQQHPVVVHSLLASKTIDHLIRERLAEKATVQNTLLKFLESPV